LLDSSNSTGKNWLVETSPGVIMGTVPYMSPEQVRATAIDARSDLFSFGSVVYEMLTGEKPFYGESDIATLMEILKSAPREIANPDIPLELKQIVLRCLEKRREDRFPGAADLVNQLKQISSQEIKRPAIDSLAILPLV